MFNKLLKLTVAGLLWSRYGTMIVSTLLLFAWFWVVGMIHQDYLEYLALQETRGSVGLSFVLKWLAFIAGVAVYWLFNSFVIRRTGRRREAAGPQSGQAPGDAGKKRLPATGGPEQDDPFDAVRHKEKLRSKVDLLIERHEHKGTSKNRHSRESGNPGAS